MVCTSQCRSRKHSLAEAKSALVEKLLQNDLANSNECIATNRKQQVGSGMRGDKIRTYMQQHGIVKDHNTGKGAPFAKIMAGYFDLLW